MSLNTRNANEKGRLAHKGMIIIPYILSFGPPKERIKEKLSGCNKTAKNLLEAASFDKLLTSFVRQYLRSSFSYGFINAVFCNAGLKKTGYPTLSVDNLPHCGGYKHKKRS